MQSDKASLHYQQAGNALRRLQYHVKYMPLTLNSEQEGLAGWQNLIGSIQDWIQHDVPVAVAIGVLPQGIKVQHVAPLAALESLIQMRSNQDLVEEAGCHLEAIPDAAAEGVECGGIKGPAVAVPLVLLAVVLHLVLERPVVGVAGVWGKLLVLGLVPVVSGHKLDAAAAVLGCAAHQQLALGEGGVHGLVLCRVVVLVVRWWWERQQQSSRGRQPGVVRHSSMQ